MTTIRIPTPLRPYVAGQSKVAVRGETVGAALTDLTDQHPDLRQHLYEGENLRSFVNVYLNKEDVRQLDGPGYGRGRQRHIDDHHCPSAIIAGGKTIRTDLI